MHFSLLDHRGEQCLWWGVCVFCDDSCGDLLLGLLLPEGLRSQNGGGFSLGRVCRLLKRLARVHFTNFQRVQKVSLRSFWLWSRLDEDEIVAVNVGAVGEAKKLLVEVLVNLRFDLAGRLGGLDDEREHFGNLELLDDLEIVFIDIEDGDEIGVSQAIFVLKVEVKPA